VGSGILGLRQWFSLDSTSVVILMNHEALLLTVLKFKEYIVDPDAETKFYGLDIYPCLDVPQEGSSKD
jgi:hypothetical protein